MSFFFSLITGRCSITPVFNNGKLFFLSETGDTYVVESNDEFTLLKTNSLDELCLATPYVSQGNLLIRTASKIYCLGNAENITD